MNNKPYIYRKQIITTGKYYIGKHNGSNKNYRGSGIDYLVDYKLYVKDRSIDLVEEILEYVDDVSILNEREIYWLEYFNAANNPLYYNKTNKCHGVIKHNIEYLQKMRHIQKEIWNKKRDENGWSINNEFINSFLKLYPTFNLTQNNKHCINYCFNKNLNLEDIICPCNNGVKYFKNYTYGYKQFCSIKCANTYNSEKSKITKENKGQWDNSKIRRRKEEIENLTKEEIEQLRRDRIKNKLLGKKPYRPHTNGNTIIQMDLNNNFIKEWPSIRKAGYDIAGTNGETIRKCLKELQKTAYGFKWKYK